MFVDHILFLRSDNAVMAVLGQESNDALSLKEPFADTGEEFPTVSIVDIYLHLFLCSCDRFTKAKVHCGSRKRFYIYQSSHFINGE